MELIINKDKQTICIENKKYINNDIASKFLNNIYGCDICQEVCPWNKKAKLTDIGTFNRRDEFVSPDPVNILNKIEEKIWAIIRTSEMYRIYAMNHAGNEHLKYILDNTNFPHLPGKVICTKNKIILTYIYILITIS